MTSAERPPVAYFSMEFALLSHIPTYSGGLGVLAGDFARAAADLGFPLVGVTLLPRRGYLYQRLDAAGNQTEEPELWPVQDYLEKVEPTCEVDIEGRRVLLHAWRYEIAGASEAGVPVFFLDTDVDGNDAYDRGLCGSLYGGDERYRLCQELVLGVGGVRMLRALGYQRIAAFHANEGHAALLGLELLEEARAVGLSEPDELEWIRRRTVFTTHTPVPAGHDRFSLELAGRVLGQRRVDMLVNLGCCHDGLNLTEVALQLSGYVNGVARSHREVARSMFPEYPIDSITNGVHSPTWTALPFQSLFDEFCSDWRHQNLCLRYAAGIEPDRLWAAHLEAKQRLIEEVNDRSNAGMDQETFTIGFARRATGYKRPTLLLRDVPRLKDIARRHGGLQLVYAGKAHPKDETGKAAIREIHQAARALLPEVKLAYLPNYRMETGLLLVAGVDLWLNTPLPPMEASGTSGMKAAHNGVPSFSVLDGWWREGHIEGVTGWSIGSADNGDPDVNRDTADADDLYQKLDETILPLFYANRAGWIRVMQQTIAHNAGFFNAQRMVQEYIDRAYRRALQLQEVP